MPVRPELRHQEWTATRISHRNFTRAFASFEGPDRLDRARCFGTDSLEMEVTNAKKTRDRLLLLPLLLVGTPVLAESADEKMHDAHAKMDQDMRAGMESGGSPDARFVKMMIPHHQGAIDMSKIARSDTKDPELRRMVDKTIEENEHGIDELKAWLKKHE